MESPDHPRPGEDALGILREEFRATLLAFGLSCTPEIERSFVDRAVNRMGGDQFYFPRVGAQRRREMHNWIRTQWTGRNTKELSKASGLSERRVRQLVSEKAEEKQ